MQYLYKTFYQSSYQSSYQKRQSQGFTLLELLIAVSLSSIVLVVLVGGFYMISKNWQHQEQQIDKAIDNSLIRLEIEKAILGAFPYSYVDDSNKQTIFFNGDELQLEFVSTMSPSYNNQLTIWSLVSNNDSGLSIYVTSALTGDPNARLEGIKADKNSAKEATIVFEDYQITFEYLEEDKANGNSWVKQWNTEKQKKLPIAIKIELKLIGEIEKTDKIIAFILANTHPTLSKSAKLNPFANTNPFMIK